MENKRVKLTNCTSQLQLVKAIKDVTKMPLLECKNIVNLMVMPSYNEITGDFEPKFGTLLLNESSITPEQWEKITQHPDFIEANVKFEYV